GFDRHHLADVGRQQPEDAGHAGVAGDHLDARGQRVEQRPGGFRTQVAQLYAPGAEITRVVDDRGRVRVLAEVAPGLVEELTGESEVLGVDVEELGDVGDVGLAVPSARGEDRRGHALETGRELLEPDAHAPPPPASGTPARGPGVCSTSHSTPRRTTRQGQTLSRWNRLGG